MWATAPGVGQRMQDHPRIGIGVPTERVCGEHRVEPGRRLAGRKDTKGQSPPRHPPQRLIECRGVATVDQDATVEEGCWHSGHKSEDALERSHLATVGMFRELSEGAKKAGVSCRDESRVVVLAHGRIVTAARAYGSRRYPDLPIRPQQGGRRGRRASRRLRCRRFLRRGGGGDYQLALRRFRVRVRVDAHIRLYVHSVKRMPRLVRPRHAGPRN